jgi:hypothetical protein
MRIRQIALVAADLPRTLGDLRFVLGLGEAYSDPGVGVFGLANGVFPIGEHFLEVVSPKQEDTSAGRYLQRRDGDGGYMVIFQSRNLDERRERLEAHGVRIVWEIELEDIATAHLHPRDTGGAIVSVDEARPYESWRWAGPSWKDEVRTQRVAGIAGVEIQGAEPDALAARWARIFELPSGRDARRLVLDDGGVILFVEDTDGRGEGIRSVLLRANDADAIREAARQRGLLVDEDGAVRVGGVRFVAS